MSTKFKSLEEFGKAAHEEKVQSLKQKIDDIFEKSIKDDFDSIPEGPFKSNLPEISWISFVRPKNNPDKINAVIFSKTETRTKDGNHVWSVSRNGVFKPTQKIPETLTKKYTQEEIALEVANLLERIGPSFIHLTDLDIVPAQDKSESESAGRGGGGGGVEQPIDPEREKFIRSLKDAKFTSVNRLRGLKGYQVVFFDNNDFVLIENLFVGNAAFILGLPEKLNMAAIEEELAAQKSGEEDAKEVSKDELRKETEKRYWQPISQQAKTRSDLVALGAQRFRHTPDTWQETLSKAIASRTQ
ncbi:MAG: hypothetical protein Q8Q89_04615 [bacterium]|nr:hypothetical protein [bacterium]